MDRALDRAAIALSALWIFILVSSGLIEREVLVLHLFQPLICLAVILLTLRDSKWAYGIAISIAFIWDDFNLRNGFVFDAGFQRWRELLHGEGVRNFVQLEAPVAWFAHVALAAVLAIRYLRRADKRALDLAGFAVSFVITLAYFAVILSLYGRQFLPRLLELFALN